MDKLISADKLARNFQSKTWYSADEVLDAISDAQGVEAEPVRHGYWVDEPDRERHWHCSECRTVQGITAMAMNYCPICGAKNRRLMRQDSVKMDGDDGADN